MKSSPMPIAPPEFTQDQKVKIFQYYEFTSVKDFNLKKFAELLGKSKTSISRYARKLGLTSSKRPKSGAPGIPKWTNKPHPKGMLGKKHTKAVLKKLSETSKASWLMQKATSSGNMAPEELQRKSASASARMALLPASKSYSRAKSGYRKDIGIFVRSSWEANYARYLNLLVKMRIVEHWEYESETFWFENIKRGTRSYRPDFKVKYKNDPTPERVEVKGWISSKDRTKWARMKKYHPSVKLVVVGPKEYQSIRNKWRSSIPEWE